MYIVCEHIEEEQLLFSHIHCWMFYVNKLSFLPHISFSHWAIYDHIESLFWNFSNHFKTYLTPLQSISFPESSALSFREILTGNHTNEDSLSLVKWDFTLLRMIKTAQLFPNCCTICQHHVRRGRLDSDALPATLSPSLWSVILVASCPGFTLKPDVSQTFSPAAL